MLRFQEMGKRKDTLVPYFLGISPSRYVKLYFSSLLMILIWLWWAENHNYTIEQVNDFLSWIYIPFSIGFLMIPILYTIHFIFYRGRSNRSSAFAQISLKNNLEYRRNQGTIISDLREIVSDYPFFSTFFGLDKSSRDYIIQNTSEPEFYMFDYGYPVYSRNVTYTFYKTVFILNCSDLDLPSFQIKPVGVFDFILRRNLKVQLPKAYVNELNGYSFWFNEKQDSIAEVVKVIPLEVLSLMQAHKGLIVEHFSNHLVVNFNNCRIPAYNLSRFFDLGVSIKNSFLKAI
tara:strand:- start:199 stop:1062 length:864 start_codon:yes stop_codon:yes gene_type:complete